MENGKQREECNNESMEDLEDYEVDLGEDILPLPLDTGYGWVITFACMMNIFIVDGTANVFGIMLVDLANYFEAEKSSVSWMGSILCGVYQMIGPIAGALVNKFGCRPVCMTGALIACVAFIISSFAPTLSVLTVTYGILGGIGFGFVSLPSMVCVSFYFQKKRALAVGLAVCGSGIGTFVMGPTTQMLLGQFGWRNTLLILSAVVLNCAVFGALMKPNEPKAKAKVGDIEEPTVRTMLLSGTSLNSDLHAKGVKAPPSIQQLAQQYVEARARMDVGHIDSISEKDERSSSGDKSKSASTVSHKSHEALNKSDKKNKLLHSLPSLTNPLLKQRRVSQTQRALSGFNLSHAIGSGTQELSLANVGDMRRPLYQRDIFYSRSVLGLNKQLIKSNQEFSKSMLFLSMARIPADPRFASEDEHPRFLKLRRLVSKPIWDALSMMMDYSLLKNPSYLLVWIANLVAMLSFYIPMFFMQDYAGALGISDTNASYLISCYGILNTLGRVAFGWLSGLPRMDPLAINNITLIASAIIVGVLPLCKTYVALIFACSALGIFLAPFICLTSEILCEIVGLDALTNAFGLLTLARGISSCFGAPFAGFMHTKEYGYTLPFLVGGGLFLLSGVMYSALHLPMFRKKVHDNKKEMESVIRSAANLHNSVYLLGGSQVIAASHHQLK